MIDDGLEFRIRTRQHDDPDRMDPPECCKCGNREVYVRDQSPGLVILCDQCHCTETVPAMFMTAGECRWMDDNLRKSD